MHSFSAQTCFKLSLVNLMIVYRKWAISNQLVNSFIHVATMEPKEPKTGDISQSLVMFEMLNVSTKQEQ